MRIFGSVTSMIDILIPKNNEEKLLEMAKKLGYNGVCFLYDKIDDKTKENVLGLGKKANVRVYFGSVYGNPASRLSDIVLGDVERINAADAIADKRIDALFGFEMLKGSDKTHHKVSGLDHVLCTMAAEKKKIIIINFGHVLRAKAHSRTVMMGRIKQNIRLCRKYKVSIAVASFASSPLEMRNPSDLLGFLAVMGHDNGKRPFEAVEERILFNLKKKEGKIIREGIEIV